MNPIGSRIFIGLSGHPLSGSTVATDSFAEDTASLVEVPDLADEDVSSEPQATSKRKTADKRYDLFGILLYLWKATREWLLSI
jgi:hypothetical protein